MKMNYSHGLKKGIPIALGYLSVSFGFGISATTLGINPFQAILISLTNLTSAGQQEGIAIMAALGTVIEMILAQFVINLRYSLMAIALSQKLHNQYGIHHRFLTAFGITDEVFVMAMSEKECITPAYMYGLITLPILGWTFGTALGAFAGEILPPDIKAALGLAIYAMFVAIIVPPARENKAVMASVLISSTLSCIIYYVPVIRAHISSGFAVIICACIASVVMAKLKPVEESEESVNG